MTRYCIVCADRASGLVAIDRHRHRHYTCTPCYQWGLVWVVIRWADGGALSTAELEQFDTSWRSREDSNPDVAG